MRTQLLNGMLAMSWQFIKEGSITPAIQKLLLKPHETIGSNSLSPSFTKSTSIYQKVN